LYCGNEDDNLIGIYRLQQAIINDEMNNEKQNNNSKGASQLA